MEIRSLAGVGFETLFAAFGRAFAEYEVQLGAEQLRSMLRRRGFDPALSFAAFDGEEIVAFTFNGIGDFGGLPTAYDTGTGTLAAYRGQGLATRVFEESIPHLRAAGIRQYLLEVLQHNTPAVSVYRNLGFGVTREFNYFLAPCAEVRRGEPTGGYSVRQVDLAQLGDVAAFWDFTPSWQNSFEAIGRAMSDFVFLGAFEGERLVGYTVFEPASGDITQIAVAPEHRRRGIGTLLLAEMLRLNRCDAVKCINTEVSCRSITGFLTARHIELAGKQFEMVKKLAVI